MSAVAERAELLRELRALRRAPGERNPRSLTAVARAAGMDRATVTHIANGDQTPKPETVARLRAAVARVRGAN